MLYYELLMLQGKRFDEIRKHRSLTSSELDKVAIIEASRVCVKQQRYYYLGPQETMPAYTHLQTAHTRYIATVIQGHGVIIELTRGEFPDVFEHYARSASADK